MAYLVCFAIWGYTFVTEPSLALVRRQLNNIEDEVLHGSTVALFNPNTADDLKTVMHVVEPVNAVLVINGKHSALVPVPGSDPNRVEMRFLSFEEVDILAEATGSYASLVLTAAYTGMRFGELAGLRSDDVSLLEGTISVRRTMSELNGRLTTGEPKTRAAMRKISVPDFVLDELGRQLPTDPSPPIFTAPDGGPLRRSNFRKRVWSPSVQASVGRPCRFHDMRHTHVAMLISQGEHPLLIASRLGHTSVRVVLDRYGHLFDGLDFQAATRLNEARIERSASLARPVRTAVTR